MVGNLDSLAGLLGVPLADLYAYAEGTKKLPEELFLKAIDIVMEWSAAPGKTERPGT